MYAVAYSVASCTPVTPWGEYPKQYEAAYVASQLAQNGYTATVTGPGGVHCTYYPRPGK